MKTIEQYRDDCARMRDLLQRACFLLDELRPKAELLDEIDKLTFDIAKLGGPVYSEADRSLRRPAGYVPCECGQILGEPCDECFPAGDIVVVEHMPQHLRASHVEGRNRGTYPANGAMRLRCYIGHALVAVESDPDWTEILGLPECARLYRDGDLWLAVESVGPNRAVRIGIGETLHEALADMQDTAIQGVGPDGGVARALDWAYGAGWCSRPGKLVEVPRG